MAKEDKNQKPNRAYWSHAYAKEESVNDSCLDGRFVLRALPVEWYDKDGEKILKENMVRGKPN